MIAHPISPLVSLNGCLMPRIVITGGRGARCFKQFRFRELICLSNINMILPAPAGPRVAQIGPRMVPAPRAGDGWPQHHFAVWSGRSLFGDLGALCAWEKQKGRETLMLRSTPFDRLACYAGYRVISRNNPYNYKYYFMYLYSTLFSLFKFILGLLPNSEIILGQCIKSRAILGMGGEPFNHLGWWMESRGLSLEIGSVWSPASSEGVSLEWNWSCNCFMHQKCTWQEWGGGKGQIWGPGKMWVRKAR